MNGLFEELEIVSSTGNKILKSLFYSLSYPIDDFIH